MSKSKKFWNLPKWQEPQEVDRDVIIPTEEETARIYETAQDGRVCGHCIHCRLRQGQEQFKDERLFEQLFDKLAYHHNKDWYGRTDMFALCAYWEGHMVHLMAPCVVPRHFVDANTDRNNRDEPAQCTEFKDKGKGGTRGTPHYIGKRHNHEEF